MTVSMDLIVWYFASIYLIFLLSVPKNEAHLEFNASFQEIKMRCIEKERLALLSFKQKLVDHYDILSSWDTNVNSDCCSWKGVECSNDTTTTHQYHIIRLDLHASDYGRSLMGDVGSSLSQLSHLRYLDLSNNGFRRIVLQNIASLMDLNYLNLSYNSFATLIPPHLGNLSKLSVLDLGSNSWSNDNFGWLISSSTFSSLKYLDLSSSRFYDANDWAIAISKLPVLQSLFLSNCYLSTPILSSSHYSYTNFSRFLVELDLSYNSINFTSSNYISWIINNSTNLVHLNLEYNILQGLNFNDFENLTSLVFLDLTYTQINFRSFKSFGSLCSLKSLHLSSNNIGGSLVSDFLKAFPPCVLHSLQSLYLASNSMTGFLPNFTMLPSLKELDLSENMLSGTIPQTLGQLSKLETLQLNQNLLEGEVCETHFAKLTRLNYLDLSNNPNLNLNFKSDWVPPFRLNYIALGYCKMGPVFPNWLQTQNFSYIDISFAEISDIVPHWFWYNLSPDLYHIDLSGNNMRGEIPNLSVKYFEQLQFINFESNKFVGRIPAFLFQPFLLYLSNNSFSDLSGLCEFVDKSDLSALDLSNNQLLGQLPNCWSSMSGRLYILDLSNNYLSGDIPYSMSNLTQLGALFLRNNQFSGGLHNLSNLTVLLDTLDVMNNNFSGTIPSWLGWNFRFLIHLNLKSNKFHGELPSTLCNLTHVQVLDISSNYISGNIPTCINNLEVLTQTSPPTDNINKVSTQAGNRRYIEIMWKHQERFITGDVLLLQKSIDLSSNQLTGKIPDEITELVGLINLNLSNNGLTGSIPNNMGQLQLLESLDVSRNRLYGPIPTSLSEIPRLTTLDLSYNNLSGKIPSSTQLQSFPNSSYEGNPYLCGDPLKECFPQHPNINNNNNVNVDVDNENEDNWFVVREFFISMTFGYIVGFWTIFGSLIFHRRWRHAYFNFLRNLVH